MKAADIRQLTFIVQSKAIVQEVDNTMRCRLVRFSSRQRSGDRPAVYCLLRRDVITVIHKRVNSVTFKPEHVTAVSIWH